MRNETKVWQFRPSIPLRTEDRVAATGTYCPTSGMWITPTWPEAAIVLLRGELMPMMNGVSVNWSYEPDLNEPSDLKQQP